MPAGRPEHRHHQPQRSGDPSQAPRDQGRHLRRFDQRRAAHLCDRRRQRQARAGADRGQEPRPGAARLRARTHRAEHHQFVLRLRRRALHGAARGGGRERDRRPAGRGDRQGLARRSSSARPTTRRPGWARWSTRATRSSSSSWIETAIEEGAKLVLDGRKPKVPRACEKGFFLGPTIFDHVTRRHVGRPRGDLRPGAVRQARRQISRRAWRS